MPVPESPKSTGIILPLSDASKSLHPQALRQETVYQHIEENLSLQGLPKGSNPAQVVRCIELLEHIARCDMEPEKCMKGEGCRRTRQVLAHHFTCKNMKRHGKDCNICHQLLALCRNHSDRCPAVKGICAVPYCKNNKQKVGSHPNKICSILPKEDLTRKQYQYVIKKLAEAMDLPTKQQKMRGIERLLVANRQVTVHILRYIIAKKQTSQPISLNNQMRNLTISKGTKTMAENTSQRGSIAVTRASTPSCLLKVFVEVFPSSTRVS